MSNGNEMKWFWLGIGVGAAAGVLFAPRSGAEARLYIQTKTRESTESILDKANGVVSAASEAVERGATSIRYQKENVLAAVESGRAAYSEAVASTPSS